MGLFFQAISYRLKGYYGDDSGDALPFCNIFLVEAKYDRNC